jgi:hypothetical protein
MLRAIPHQGHKSDAVTVDDIRFTVSAVAVTAIASSIQITVIPGTLKNIPGPCGGTTGTYL